jgi:hypothetical protein
MRLTAYEHPSSARGLPSAPYTHTGGLVRSSARQRNAVVPFHIRVNLRAVRLIDPEYLSSLLGASPPRAAGRSSSHLEEAPGRPVL